jgi:Skp family chaperone for outer membrane proteins
MQEKIRSTLEIDLSWWTRAVVWFRRWGWIPVAVLIAVLAFAAGGFIFRRRKDGKVMDPLSDIREAVVRNNQKIDAELQAEAIERDRRIASIEQEHAATIAALDEDQKKRAQQYRRNPDQLARWLTGLATNKD